MSESRGEIPGATDADRQEQAIPATSVDGTEESGGPGRTAGGTGGSEADLQEQATPADGGAGTSGIAGEGTGGSEADRLEQAAAVPLDGEDAFPHATDDDVS